MQTVAPTAKSLYKAKEDKKSAVQPAATMVNGLTAYTPNKESFQSTSSDMKICNFCHLEEKIETFEAHEEYCGSRTEQCPECNDFVMLKEWEKHQSMRLYHGKTLLTHY